MWSFPLSHQTVYRFSICYLFLIFLSHVLCCVMPDLVMLLLHSQFQPPLDSQRNMFSSITSCLSILPTYWPCIVLFPIFSFKESPNLSVTCWMRSFLCVTLLIWLVQFFCNLCCRFNSWIRIWLIDFVTFKNIFKLVFCIFCVQIFCIIDYLLFIDHFNL